MEKAIQKNANAVYENDACWFWAKTALLVEHTGATTIDVRTAMRAEFRKELKRANPLALKWRKNEILRKRDSLRSAALAEKLKEDELLVRGPSRNALLEEFSRSLTIKETENILAEVREANPSATAKEFGAAYRAFKVQAALVWHRSRAHKGKDSSLPLAGTAKPTEPLSLEAQPKSDASTTVRYYLSLTKEEELPCSRQQSWQTLMQTSRRLTKLTKLLCGKQTA
jgi:hypothetical protein